MSNPFDLVNGPLRFSGLCGFARALSERLLTYALGRGLERFDKPVIEGIVNRAIAEKYRFSSIVLGIVRSMPFQMVKPELPRTADNSELAKGIR